MFTKKHKHVEINKQNPLIKLNNKLKNKKKKRHNKYTIKVN